MDSLSYTSSVMFSTTKSAASSEIFMESKDTRYTNHSDVSEPHTDQEYTELDSEEWLRRSIRNPQVGVLNRPEVQKLLDRIRENHHDTIVLKLKNHLRSDINKCVFEEIISALHKNKVCQALYIQNLQRAIGDDQLKLLMELLKKKKIWCLNIGENYDVSPQGWVYFCHELPNTNITHLYVSEHMISLKLKNQMRDYIRENRKKHDKHKSLRNIEVISKCTNMWWNPINAIRHQLESKPLKLPSKHTVSVTSSSSLTTTATDTKKKRRHSTPTQNIKSSSSSSTTNTSSPISTKKQRRSSNSTSSKDDTIIEINEYMRQYWIPGGPSGLNSWSFSCKCGEKCSSYENYRYHPIGRMYECTSCHIWSHVDCVIGSTFTDEDLEEMEDVYCFKCQCRSRRRKLSELRQLNLSYHPDKDGNITIGHTDNSTTSSSSSSCEFMNNVIKEVEKVEEEETRDYELYDNNKVEEEVVIVNTSDIV